MTGDKRVLRPCSAMLPRVGCVVQASGRATSSVQWGAWGGSGMATRVHGFMDRMARMGLGVLQPAQGLAVIGRVLAAAACPFASPPPLSPVIVGVGFCKTRISRRVLGYPGICTIRY